ncbi:MAG: hypothetical protein ABW133_01255, partial [Polyangiaceae bacterium]
MPVLRRLARFRPLFVPALVVLPAVVVLGSDLARRWHRLPGWSAIDGARYGLALFESAVLWSGLLLLASRRRGAVRWFAAAVFVVLGALSLGCERYFYDQFETYLNADAALFGAAFPASLRGQIAADGAGLLRALAVPFALFLTLAILARKWVRPPRRAIAFAHGATLLGAVAIAVAPCSYRTVQAAPPDVIFLHAMGSVVKEIAAGTTAHVEPGIRKAPYLPVVAPSAGSPRNVLLVLTESVRFDSVCTAHEAECPRSPFTNAATPGRIPFLQMRANSSTTAISFGVLLSGLGPNETRSSIHDAPL